MNRGSEPTVAAAHDPQREVVMSLRGLRAALDDGLAFLSDDDIERMPQAAAVEHLRALGVAPKGPSRQAVDGRDEGADCRRAAPCPPAVPRDDTLALLAGELRRSPRVAVVGCAGAGKTHLLRLLALGSAHHGADPRRAPTWIDCAALRMRSAELFEREAVWAAFGRRDDAFREFVNEGPSPLLRYLSRRHPRGGLLVVDHFEHLERSGETYAWLEQKLLAHAEGLGVGVVLCRREPDDDAGGAGRLFQALPRIAVGPLGAAELGAWLREPFFARHVAEGLTAARVLRVTGGSPALVRDLGRFLAASHESGWRALCAFARWRADNGYMTDCERYVRAACRFPALLEHRLGGVDHPPRGPLTRRERQACELGREAAARLLATGAVTRGGDGRLRFASPIHARRVGLLTGGKNLLRLVLRADIRWMDRTGELRQLRRWAELAAEPLARCLAAERDPRAALRRFQEVLGRWHFDAELYIRDPDNARLWSLLDDDGPGRPWPLSADERPDLARAAQTGGTAEDEEGRVYLPLTGNSGLVEMVVAGSFRSEPGAEVRQIEVDKLAGLVRGLRPTLAQALERWTLRRERRFRERVLQRMKRVDPARGRRQIVDALSEARCDTVAVLERNAGAWIVTSLDVVRPVSGEPAFQAGWAEPADVARLDAIAMHPSSRGLVLSGEVAADVFPRLRGRDAAVFLRPVWMHGGRICRIVAFLFDSRASRALDGQLQFHLSMVAPNAVAMAS